MALGPRGQTVIAIVKGILAALLLTAALMALIALIVVRTGLPDHVLTAVNQLVKVASIFLGSWVAVRPGGQRGFALGASVGLLYMLAGYAAYCALDGALLTAWLLAGEFVMGAGIGALSGALVANLNPSKRRASRRRKRGKSAPA